MRVLDNGDVVMTQSELAQIKAQVQQDLTWARDRGWPGYERFQSVKLLRLSIDNSKFHTTAMQLGLNPKDWET
ncbi:hypothetical protein BABAYKA_00040 [Brevundimonas phage vB_BpoS-Babayka]|uniref:Uncharacterized protein n=1 Tax=Brevundimonas phage vB_BpoS-Babayka TaxID=2948596 RepID=A0A9E7MVN3_9CAUD|nr:hypothetical protein BABAYKA_00040 [Brevundimonas phage vB_BpoS-Babayka]